MRGIYLTGLAAMAMLIPACPAFASAPSEDAGTTVNPKDRVVCKRTQRTGTRFYDKICKTAGQWDAIAEEHRRNLAETVDRPQIEIRRE